MAPRWSRDTEASPVHLHCDGVTCHAKESTRCPIKMGVRLASFAAAAPASCASSALSSISTFGPIAFYVFESVDVFVGGSVFVSLCLCLCLSLAVSIWVCLCLCLGLPLSLAVSVSGCLCLDVFNPNNSNITNAITCLSHLCVS